MTRGTRLHSALILATILLCGSPMTPAEQVPSFNLPVACTPGMDCWIVNYFDHNPGPGMLDYACGQLSYDSHGGTDYHNPGPLILRRLIGDNQVVAGQ